MDNEVPAPSSSWRHMFSVQFVGAAITGTTRSITFFSSLRLWGTAVAQWLRCCATNRKVAGSIIPVPSRTLVAVVAIFLLQKFFPSQGNQPVETVGGCRLG